MTEQAILAIVPEAAAEIEAILRRADSALIDPVVRVSGLHRPHVEAWDGRLEVSGPVSDLAEALLIEGKVWAVEALWAILTHWCRAAMARDEFEWRASELIDTLALKASDAFSICMAGAPNYRDDLREELLTELSEHRWRVCRYNRVYSQAYLMSPSHPSLPNFSPEARLRIESTIEAATLKAIQRLHVDFDSVRPYYSIGGPCCMEHPLACFFFDSIAGFSEAEYDSHASELLQLSLSADAFADILHTAFPALQAWRIRWIMPKSANIV